MLKGDAELSEVASDPDDAATDELVALYRSLSGEHADWAAPDGPWSPTAERMIRVRPTRGTGWPADQLPQEPWE